MHSDTLSQKFLKIVYPRRAGPRKTPRKSPPPVGSVRNAQIPLYQNKKIAKKSLYPRHRFARVELLQKFRTSLSGSMPRIFVKKVESRYSQVFQISGQKPMVACLPLRTIGVLSSDGFSMSLSVMFCSVET